jgi:hypothetical protein
MQRVGSPQRFAVSIDTISATPLATALGDWLGVAAVGFALCCVSLCLVWYRTIAEGDTHTAGDTAGESHTADGEVTGRPATEATVADGSGRVAEERADTPPAGGTATGGTPTAVTDETHVLALLEANNGRVRQTHIVEETDWSESKVSAVLSEMDEAGRITKLRLGRENVICLDGEEPELATPPFEDDPE